ncbi:MAG TPA: hypothetical protein VNC61_10510 [Acidimicrobiales bacterium]|nr:hypothetical protein [Acidimicrobiales bacterium]
MTPAFVVVFALFVLALGALVVISVRWGVRRDRAARAVAAARREEASRPGPGTPPPGPASR